MNAYYRRVFLFFKLVIKAQDRGQYPRADIGFVTVSITNKNEHSPVVSPASLIGGKKFVTIATTPTTATKTTTIE